MTMQSTQTYSAGQVLTADSLGKHVTEATPTAFEANCSIAGFDLTSIGELAFADEGAASAGGRIRRNGVNLEWHNGTASGRIFFAGGVDVPVADGGTGLSSGTSGGVPYFSASTTMASSAALAANQIVLGGGAGAAPATLGGLGTTTTLLHGNAAGAPTFGAVVLTTDVSGQLPMANGGTGANLVDPNADRILFWDDSEGAIGFLTASTGLTITATNMTASGFNVAAGSFSVTAGASGSQSVTGLSFTPKAGIFIAARGGGADGASWGVSTGSQAPVLRDQSDDTNFRFGDANHIFSVANNAVGVYQVGQWTSWDSGGFTWSNSAGGGGYALTVSYLVMG